MKVRVFLYVGEPDRDYDGEDFEFETMPQVGQFLRISGEGDYDDEIEKIGFIQEDDKFIAAVWLKPPPTA